MDFKNDNTKDTTSTQSKPFIPLTPLTPPRPTITSPQTNNTTTTTQQPINIMNQVFASCQKIIDRMEQHDRITMTELADLVSNEVKAKNAVISAFVSMYIEGQVAEKKGEKHLGAGGGYFLGGKKPHIDNRPRCETCKQVIPQRANSSYHSTFTSLHARAQNTIRLNDLNKKKAEEEKK